MVWSICTPAIALVHYNYDLRTKEILLLQSTPPGVCLVKAKAWVSPGSFAQGAHGELSEDKAGPF